MWKLIVKTEPTWADLEEVDLNYARSLGTLLTSAVTSGAQSPTALPADFFEGISFSGKPVSLFPTGKTKLARENQREFALAAFRQRVSEMEIQVASVFPVSKRSLSDFSQLHSLILNSLITFAFM